MTVTVIDMQFAAQDAESRWTDFASRVQETRERLAQTDEPTLLLALVDARSVPELRAALTRLAQVPFVALWDGTDLAAHQDIAPLLIEIDLQAEDAGAAHGLLKRLWRLSDGGFLVTWIWTDRDLDEVAGHLRTYCEYTLPDRRSFYLHFYDNRILERLRQVWSPEEWSGFASVSHEIWYRQRSVEPAIWRLEAGTTAMVRSVPFEMSHEQHRALIAMGYADKVALQLRELYGALLDELSSDQLYLAVQSQIERATHHGVKDEHDMLLYVAKGLFVSPTFDEHPLIREGLVSVRYGHGSLSQVLSQVDELVGGDYGGGKDKA